jgi:hypothetical protein
MDRRTRTEASTEQIKPVFDMAEIDEAWFDTSYVGRPEQVFGYRIDKSCISKDIVEDGSEMYQRILLMDDARVVRDDWDVVYSQPHKEIDDSIKIELRKKYNAAGYRSTLSRKELQEGELFVQASLDPEVCSEDKLEELLK